MPSKKEKQQQQALLAMKAQAAPLGNSTNTLPAVNTNPALSNSYHTVTTTTMTTSSTKKTSNLNHDPLTASQDHLSLIRDQKTELDELNNRFSIYVLALRKKSKENGDLQKQVDTEKQKNKSVARRDHGDLEAQMGELRNEIDESAVFTEHFLLKRNRALKELALLKDKVRAEDEQSFATRRQALENEYQQSVIQLKELTRRCQDLEASRQASQAEMNQLNDLYKKLEEELHDLILNNIRLECNLRTIEEQTLLTKAIHETEKAELASEQVKQQQFYTNELDQAIADIKADFQILLKSNKVMLENAYTERIEQVKSQISTYQQSKEQEASLAPRTSIESLHTDLKQSEKVRDDIDKEYRPLLDLYLTKQKEKNGIDEERARLDLEYNRLISEINQMTEAIEVGKRYWFSVHFELETYRRLLDLQISNPTLNNHHVLSNGKEEHAVGEEQTPQIIVKKLDSQRAISKTGKFDLDQVQAGFVSINNASENCVDQSLKGWSLVRTINDGEESTYQFPDSYVLKARTRVRVYSSKVENTGGSSVINSRLIASAVPTWTSTGQNDNVKILLVDEKGNTRATYTETWQ